MDDERWAARCAKGRVVAIDDDTEILKALGGLLELEGYAVEVHASAASFLNSMQSGPAHFPGPVCLLCDVQMPLLTGLELQRRLMDWDDLPLLLMSGASGAEDVACAFRAGALDFLVKPIDADVLLASVGRALAVSTERRAAHQTRLGWQERAARLTDREREVATLVTRGMTNQAVADQLNISLRTVKLHRGHAMQKLGAASIADLVRIMDQL